MDLMRFSVWFVEVSGGLFEVVSSLESSPRGTGVGKAVAITRSSPREKATGLKVPVPEGRESSSEQTAQLGELCFWLLAARQPHCGPAHTPSQPGAAARPVRARDFRHLLVKREFIAGFLEGDAALFPSWWARGQNEPQTSPLSYLLGVDTLILRLMGKSHI